MGLGSADRRWQRLLECNSPSPEPSFPSLPRLVTWQGGRQGENAQPAADGLQGQ